MIMRNLLHNIYINLIRLWAMSISSSTAAIIPYISLSRDLFPLSITCGTRQTRYSNIENCCYCLQGVSFFSHFLSKPKKLLFYGSLSDFLQFLGKIKNIFLYFPKKKCLFQVKKAQQLAIKLIAFNLYNPPWCQISINLSKNKKKLHCLAPPTSKEGNH